MQSVNEGSTAWLALAFSDRNGSAASPTAITYRIDDVTGGGQVRANTEIGAPAASVEIELTPEDNAILSTRQRERRRVTVQAIFSGGRVHNQQYLYDVVNLEKIAAGNELGPDEEE